jgi:hypothetical protein
MGNIVHILTNRRYKEKVFYTHTHTTHNTHAHTATLSTFSPIAAKLNPILYPKLNP